MAFTLFGLIGFSIWLGLYLDDKYETSQKYFTAGLSFLVTVGFLIKVSIELSKPDKPKHESK